ncbi:1,2-phenylacetyl-CoA epoxidase subunit PaaC [Falsiroseomonas oryziterrae]|uniref:1,2-phenylacetyl-CoA epoxidase subunit PaaC n=1 Tax=Falsiroseomonas oryziterrae TaxID=2911368 RepID=UPI001F031021|nr:1,2-phenylacetyl-CoA epoxidase subunit PaaC [Roseomonas sp. NPKOSM-4]
MTTITLAETPLLHAVLARADDALVHAHRLSEWVGHAPMLEEDLALGNVALDLLGQARSLYTYAAEVEGKGRTEDDLAYLRDAPSFRNLLLLEQPNGDFAQTIVRLFLHSAVLHPFWRTAMGSSDATLAAIAAKAEKEVAYHLRHSAEWLIRLGDGTEESHRRAQEALDRLWRFTGEMFAPEDADLVARGVLPDPASLRPEWDATVARVLAEATLDRPKDGWMQQGGRRGVHTEPLGHMLAVMQHLQRAYPGATW